MRLFALLTLVGFSGLSSASGQFQTLVLKPSLTEPIPPETINIAAGDYIEVAFVSASNTTIEFRVDGQRLTTSATEKGGFKIAGPATFEVAVPSPNPSVGAGAVVVYRILKNSSTGEQSGPFSGSAVVIPEDASGPVEIVLESSTDLVNWTPANPGTYGSSTEKRFFRVRAVVQSGNPPP